MSQHLVDELNETTPRMSVSLRGRAARTAMAFGGWLGGTALKELDDASASKLVPAGFALSPKMAIASSNARLLMFSLSYSSGVEPQRLLGSVPLEDLEDATVESKYRALTLSFKTGTSVELTVSARNVRHAENLVTIIRERRQAQLDGS